MRSRKVLAIVVLLVGVVTSIGLAYLSPDKGVIAQGDTESPRIVSLDVVPSFVDTSTSDQTITMTIHVIDNLSGFHEALVTFARLSPEGSTLDPEFRVYAFSSDLISGTEINGVFRHEQDLRQFSAQGRWYLWQIILGDNTGNYCLWNYRSLARNECALKGNRPYFVNGIDNGPPATAIPTPTDTDTPTATPTPTLTPSDTPTVTPDIEATQTASANEISTAVAATLTAVATPDIIATETAISNQVATSVAATLTALAPQPTEGTGTPQPTEETGTPQPNRLSLPNIIR